MKSLTKMFSSWGHWIFLLLFLLFMPQLAATAEIEESDLSPYLENYVTGWIDWDNGYIYGIGTGFLDKNNNSRPRALGAARVVASGNIVKLAAGIHLDDRRTLSSLGSGRVLLELKAFLQYEEVEKELVTSDSPHFNVVYRVPFHGISGMTARLLNGLKEKSVGWSEFPGKNSTNILTDQDLPWLVLDARNLPSGQTVAPALFPKVVTRTGTTVYELNGVDQTALLERGMASYVVSGAKTHYSRGYRKGMEQVLAELAEVLFPAEAIAAEPGRRMNREQFIVKKVEDLQGQTRTNLVISEKDAQELNQEDASSQILEKCRVIIIVSSRKPVATPGIPGPL